MSQNSFGISVLPKCISLQNQHVISMLHGLAIALCPGGCLPDRWHRHCICGIVGAGQALRPSQTILSILIDSHTGSLGVLCAGTDAAEPNILKRMSATFCARICTRMLRIRNWLCIYFKCSFGQRLGQALIVLSAMPAVGIAGYLNNKLMFDLFQKVSPMSSPQMCWVPFSAFAGLMSSPLISRISSSPTCHPNLPPKKRALFSASLLETFGGV